MTTMTQILMALYAKLFYKKLRLFFEDTQTMDSFLRFDIICIAYILTKLLMKQI